MIIHADQVQEKVNEKVRGGQGVVKAKVLVEAMAEGSYIKAMGLNRLPAGSSIGLHKHEGEEDFYFCISGKGVVTDNGRECEFVPGTLQITRHGETQALRNTGDEDLVFLGGLVEMRGK